MGLGRRDKLGLARKTGFDAILWRNELALFDTNGHDRQSLFADCLSAKMRCIVEVDVATFPLDHDLVNQCPDMFAVRRSGHGEAPVDPRTPLPAAGTARARLRNPEAAHLVGKAIGSRLAEMVGEGVGGFRLLRPEALSPEAVTEIVDALSDHEVAILAGPFGTDRTAGVSLASAGVDYLITSFAGWDLRASWFLDEAENFGWHGPVVAELRESQLSGDTVEGAIERLLMGAAATAQGVIIPDALLARCSAVQPVIERVKNVLEKTRRYHGALRRLSNSSDPVTAIMRSDKADPRMADGVLLAFINVTDVAQPSPTAGDLIQRAGVALDLTQADLTDLGPCEVRLIEAGCAKAIGDISRGNLRVSQAAEAPRIVIEAITPSVEGGDFAVKRVVGDTVNVSATIFTDGHEQLAAELRWRACDSESWNARRMKAAPNDRWAAEFTLDRMGVHEFAIESWIDRFGGFRRDFRKKLVAGVAQPVDDAEGRALVEAAAKRSRGKRGKALKDWCARLNDAGDGEKSAALLLDDALLALMDEADDRPHLLTSPAQRVDAERLAARYSSWYELFPRSITSDNQRHGTFLDVIGDLPRIRDMGFDTLYFPPIHPIGRTNRKGPNNTLTPGPDDPGSPYAIGGLEGGHDALHPELGSWQDFDRLVAAAHDHGLEIALDFAIQASPDHPWLTQHPGWFAWRPDGSMKYAENPPKKYQDIVNVDFYGPDAVPDLWDALRDIVLLWVERGVKVFRVDNPHTKPLPFWEWMIRDIRGRHPEVIFLSEAFTRPAMMYRLAKVGFSQSYTYFTWRDRKQELIDYITELTSTPPKEFYRPHFFVNTPDINPFYLQSSGRPGFRIRAVLAATLSGLFGVYSGFELCEAAPLGPGKEEYLDSEKYEIRPRDWNAAGNIISDITLLNRLRRAHPALQTHLNTRFYVAHNDQIIWYGKPSPNGREMIMVMINLDPHHPQECDFEVPLWEFGLPDDAGIAVEDLNEGHRFTWHGKIQHIRIAPDLPFRLWRISAEAAA